ncbi:hypothetical protein LCGC14_1559440 [marine sediment metagenome]|uniref:Uncharacterized protein n=1 Tax=marine sediment metagenome TaxID=412755 RepID=A0A0F9L4D4_9ZZZZ
MTPIFAKTIIVIITLCLMALIILSFHKDERGHRDKVDNLKAEVEKLRGALEWYADKKNYDAFLSTDFDGEPIKVPRINLDGGKTAQAALEQK